MLKLTLPSLPKAELSDLLAPSLTSFRPTVEPPPPVPDKSSLESLLQALQGAEEVLTEARRIADKANVDLQALERRADWADAQRRRLTQEVLELQERLDKVQRLPRWVKKMLGVA